MKFRERLSEAAESIRENEEFIKTEAKKQDKLQRDRKHAIQEAAKPFDEEISASNLRIHELQSQSLEVQFNPTKLGEIVGSALQLEAQARYPQEDYPISRLASDYELLAKGERSWRAEAAEKVVARVAEFEDFHDALDAQGEVPVVIAATEWDWTYPDEESPSMVVGSLYLGSLALKDIMVRHDYKNNLEGVDLLINGMECTTVDRSQGYHERREKSVSRHEVVTLFGKNIGNSVGSRTPKQPDWKIIPAEELSSPHVQGGQRIVAWGEAAHSVDILNVD